MVKKQDKGGSIDLGAVAAPVILYGLRSLMTPEDAPMAMKKKSSGKRRFTKGGNGEGEQQSTPAVACPSPVVAQPATASPAPVQETNVPLVGVAPGSGTGGKADKKKGGMRDLLDRLLQRGGENGMMVANQEVAPPVVAPPAAGGEVVGAVDVTSLMGVEGTVEAPAPVPGMEGGKKMKKRSSAKKQRGGEDMEQLVQAGGKKKQQKGGEDMMDQFLQEQQGGKKMKKRASAKKQRGGEDMDMEQLLQAGGKKQKKSTKGGALDMYAKQLDQIMQGLQGMM